MSPRKWCKSRYFKPVQTRMICDKCGDPFHYVKLSKPRKYCPICKRKVHLAQMRIFNEFMRNLERAARTA